eukprot:symbB.v1.2.015280.t1/scaffold1136.1/size135929/8
MAKASTFDTSSDSEEDQEALQSFPDWPTVAAEIAILALAILGLLLLLAGFGFWTVHPPGESELCQVDTLGLQNLTLARQRSQIAACHALYDVVFGALGVISLPFLLRLCCIAILEAFGAVVVWLPSWFFPSISLAVAAGLAPIHAYFISITAGHLAISISGADSGTSTANKAAHLFQVLYTGYCAASRVELCLTIGSISLLLLFWCFVIDILRIISAMTCWRSKLEDPRGFELWHLVQLLRRR